MKRGYSMVREAVRQCPLPLSSIDGKLRQYAESLLPYFTGIEIECSHIDKFSSRELDDVFLDEIPELLSSKTDVYEKRFKIPKGIQGFITLYNLSEALKKYCRLNVESGIHYHIDFMDTSFSAFQELKMAHFGTNSWILKALKSWNYTGEFNRWEVSSTKTAVRFHPIYQTLEFRIGEMTFDYELLVKRILHCQNISRALKSSLKSSHPNKKGETKVASYPRIIGRIEL
jgi:hypothetical protein